MDRHNVAASFPAFSAMQIMLASRADPDNRLPLLIIDSVSRLEHNGPLGPAPIALHSLQLQLVPLGAAWICPAAVCGP